MNIAVVLGNRPPAVALENTATQKANLIRIPRNGNTHAEHLKFTLLNVHSIGDDISPVRFMILYLTRILTA